jgi:hypothetical protein
VTRLSQILHLDDGEFPALRAEIESKPLPAKRRAGVHTPLRPLPFGAPARAVAAMADLRAADAPVLPTAPSAPPSRDLVEFQTAVACAMHADHAMQVDTIAVIDAIAALAPDAHTVAMALAPVVALLAEDAPDTGWGVHAAQLGGAL